MGNMTTPSIEEMCRFLSDPALDGRYPGGEGHETAKHYLTGMLEQLAFQPLFGNSWSQEIKDGAAKLGENLGGVWPGRSGRRILLGAHYDHFKGIPGADDNAAALSILIETCRLLDQWSGEHDLVLCFFDLEEPPHFHTPTMGSTYFTENCPFDLDTVDCAIILDLCGHEISLRHLLSKVLGGIPAGVPEACIPDQRNGVFVMGAEYSCDLLHAVRSIENSPIPVYPFPNEKVGDMSDHHAFRLHGIPFLFFSCGWWEHYHQPTDTFDQLSLSTMNTLAEFLARLVPALDVMSIGKQPVPAFEKVEKNSLSRLLLGGSPPILTSLLTKVMSRFMR